MRGPLAPPPWLLVLAASLASGALVGLAGPPLEAPPLLMAGLVPFVALLMLPGMGAGRAAVAGLAVGVSSNLVLALILQLPVAFSAVLVLSLSAGWAAAGGACGALLARLRPAWALVVIPAALTLADLGMVRCVPVFATAQSLARPLAAWPDLVQIAALVGFSGPVLVLTSLQTGVAFAAVHARSRARLAAGIALALAAFTTAGLVLGLRRAEAPIATVRVAAVGWTYAGEGSPWRRPGSPSRQVETLLAPWVHRAAALGARVVVAPEVSFAVERGERAELLSALAQLAREAAVVLVVGFFDGERDVNVSVVHDADGVLLGEVVKTHLIPGMEGYTAGHGELLVVDTAPARLGTLICQDDNFTDLGRAYGRAGVQLLAVPTNDWEQVQRFHLQNVRLRAVDSGVGVVRGASNGISAVIDARGRLRASMDHHAEGSGVVVADLPLYRGGSLHARTGHPVPLACALVLAVAAVAGLRTWRR